MTATVHRDVKPGNVCHRLRHLAARAHWLAESLVLTAIFARSGFAARGVGRA